MCLSGQILIGQIFIDLSGGFVLSEMTRQIFPTIQTYCSQKFVCPNKKKPKLRPFLILLVSQVSRTFWYRFWYRDTIFFIFSFLILAGIVFGIVFGIAAIPTIPVSLLPCDTKIFSIAGIAVSIISGSPIYQNAKYTSLYVLLIIDSNFYYFCASKDI